MAFRIFIDEDVRTDIQESIDWYNEQKQGLGKQFFTQVKATINRLKSNPFFQIRYDDVRCLPIKRFPFMVHFTVDESQKKVVIRAYRLLMYSAFTIQAKDGLLHCPYNLI